MKIVLSAAALGVALMISGAGVSTASAAATNKAATVHKNAGGNVTDFSARRRGYGYGPRYGYRGYGPRYYARPYGYGGGYGYGGPRYYGGYGYGGPRFGFY